MISRVGALKSAGAGGPENEQEPARLSEETPRTGYETAAGRRARVAQDCQFEFSYSSEPTKGTIRSRACSEYCRSPPADTTRGAHTLQAGLAVGRGCHILPDWEGGPMPSLSPGRIQPTAGSLGHRHAQMRRNSRGWRWRWSSRPELLKRLCSNPTGAASRRRWASARAARRPLS